ncbi:MAG: lipopolysaccharide transport periplasmic protein LptA [Azoarcus sp.]|jgi:lipopolysaccharide export system protein LptA|nr:lipopolysaccharide transport periplasmic protein LptA [Azoarcus sp.]
MRALAAFAAAVLLASPLYAAPNADRDQPVDIDADRVNVDDRNKVSVFEGNVVLTQGSMSIKSDKLVVTQDAEGFYNGVATANGGRLATFRQKRASDGSWVDGEAERIEYSSRADKAKLFNRAQVKNGGDLVRGQYIEYDAVTENYLVTDAPGRAPQTTSGEKPRVHVTIQPRKNDRKNAGASE